MLVILKSACECNADGSEDNQCHMEHGKCTCKPNITGDKCDESVPGYFDFPNPKGVYIFSRFKLHMLCFYTLNLPGSVIDLHRH